MTGYSSAKFAVDNGWPDRGQTSAEASENGTYTIGDLAREFGVSLRTLRFYQAKGLLAPTRNGKARRFSAADCERLKLILQGKRLHFTLLEVHAMLAAHEPGSGDLRIGRKQCVEQIKLLERQRRDVERALHELRQIYTGMFKFDGAERSDSDETTDA